MTAENAGARGDEGVQRARASMRPRPMTAENADGPRRRDRVRTASMRPRPMTAENAHDAGDLDEPRRLADASMRPRPMTAENSPAPSPAPAPSPRFNEAAADDRGKRGRRVGGSVRSACFNEAAADDRGKRRRDRVRRRRRRASMRPRPMTAENSRPGPHLRSAANRFNEAAADDRGKPPGGGSCRTSRRGFNEAAADDRGKRAFAWPAESGR